MTSETAGASMRDLPGGLARPVTGGRAWNWHRWQQWDLWQETGLVTFPNHPGEPQHVRAECQCTWHGQARPVDMAPATATAAVKADWDKHIAAAEHRTDESLAHTG